MAAALELELTTDTRLKTPLAGRGPTQRFLAHGCIVDGLRVWLTAIGRHAQRVFRLAGSATLTVGAPDAASKAASLVSE